MSEEKRKTEYSKEEDLWEPEISSEFQKSNNFVSDSDSVSGEDDKTEEPFIPDIPAFTDMIKFDEQSGKQTVPDGMHQKQTGHKNDPDSGIVNKDGDRLNKEEHKHFTENVWSYKKEKERIKFAKQKYKEECRKLKKERRQRGPGWRKLVMTGFICGITGGVVSCMATAAVLSISAKVFNVDLLGLRPEKIIEKNVVAEIKEYESNAEAVADKAGPAVVCLKVNNAPSASIWGVQTKSSEYASGVVYSEDGYIITSFDAVKSVVEENGTVNSKASVEVYLQEDKRKGHKAELVGYDGNSDVALLKIDVNNLTQIEFGNSDEIISGQKVYSIDCPGGVEFIGSIKEGIISGIDRKLTSNQVGDINLIQTNIEYCPGSNGGALLDSQGKLIGINGKIIINKEYSDMGFSIPSNRVKEVCKSILGDNE